MNKFNRRSFLKLFWGSAALLGLGLRPKNVWAQNDDTNERIGRLETDVVVIGAGPAGLSAAMRTAELGLKVCLFEKTGKTGGTRNGGMGPFGAGTHIQEKYGIEHCSTEDAFNYLMDFNHWKIDARLASEFINHTAFTVKWLEHEGILFSPMTAEGHFGSTFMHAFAPHPDYKQERNFYACSLLTDRIRTQPNIKVFMETPAKKLIKTGNALTGLVAVDKYGNKIEVSAKAVIMATGGFMGNPEMIKKFTSFNYQKDLFYTFEMPNLSGDGIKMAWEVGAAKSEMMMDVYKGMPIFGGPAGTRMDWTLLANPNLMVNLQGERFINEALEDRYMMANAIHRQTKGCGFLMFDGTIADIYRNQKPDEARAGLPDEFPPPVTDIDEIVSEAGKLKYPYLFAANSLEDLCMQTGIRLEGLKATIAEYNSMCDAGDDPIFYKDASCLLPLRKPKYYAAQFCCDSFGGLGGIKINHKTEVIDETFKAIPGFYASGSDVNTMYADTYPGYLSGNTTGFAFTTGLMAAKSAADFINVTHSINHKT